jgi:hypothetical protein
VRHDRLEDFHPRHRRHVQIDDDDVVRVATDHFDRFVATATRRYGVALDLQDARAAFAQRAVVIYDKNPDRGELSARKRLR